MGSCPLGLVGPCVACFIREDRCEALRRMPRERALLLAQGLAAAQPGFAHFVDEEGVQDEAGRLVMWVSEGKLLYLVSGHHSWCVCQPRASVVAWKAEWPPEYVLWPFGPEGREVEYGGLRLRLSLTWAWHCQVLTPAGEYTLRSLREGGARSLAEAVALARRRAERVLRRRAREEELMAAFERLPPELKQGALTKRRKLARAREFLGLPLEEQASWLLGRGL